MDSKMSQILVIVNNPFRKEIKDHKGNVDSNAWTDNTS